MRRRMITSHNFFNLSDFISTSFILSRFSSIIGARFRFKFFFQSCGTQTSMLHLTSVGCQRYHSCGAWMLIFRFTHRYSRLSARCSNIWMRFCWRFWACLFLRLLAACRRLIQPSQRFHWLRLLAFQNNVLTFLVVLCCGTLFINSTILGGNPRSISVQTRIKVNLYLFKLICVFKRWKSARFWTQRLVLVDCLRDRRSGIEGLTSVSPHFHRIPTVWQHVASIVFRNERLILASLVSLPPIFDKLWCWISCALRRLRKEEIVLGLVSLRLLSHL